MTPLSRDLHPSNGRRAPKDEVVVSITSAPHHRGRKQEEQLPADHDELDETFPTPQQQALLIADGDLLEVVNHPIALGFLAAAALILLSGVLPLLWFKWRGWV